MQGINRIEHKALSNPSREMGHRCPGVVVLGVVIRGWMSRRQVSQNRSKVRHVNSCDYCLQQVLFCSVLFSLSLLSALLHCVIVLKLALATLMAMIFFQCSYFFFTMKFILLCEGVSSSGFVDITVIFNKAPVWIYGQTRDCSKLNRFIQRAQTFRLITRLDEIISLLGPLPFSELFLLLYIIFTSNLLEYHFSYNFSSILRNTFDSFFLKLIS